MGILVAKTVAELRETVGGWRGKGARVALVPTMGALHEGHLELVRQGAAQAGSSGRVVVSIFVNPAQFAPHEDFDRYPRAFEADAAKLETTGGAHLIYAPSVREMYPEGFATRVLVNGPAAGLESDFRPHFFGGVATVVAKLFTQCRPDIAMFGEKDYQQLLVVRRMARDLDLGVEVVGVPIVREADGLAMSSRNGYLSPEERNVAGQLNRALANVAKRAREGVSIPVAEAEGNAALLGAGFQRVDYVAVRDAETLAMLRDVSRPARVLAAAWLGKTRLIDNVAVDSELLQRVQQVQQRHDAQSCSFRGG
jgi:pantoate--beta-alanine ligase